MHLHVRGGGGHGGPRGVAGRGAASAPGLLQVLVGEEERGLGLLRLAVDEPLQDGMPPDEPWAREDGDADVALHVRVLEAVGGVGVGHGGGGDLLPCLLALEAGVPPRLCVLAQSLAGVEHHLGVEVGGLVEQAHPLPALAAGGIVQLALGRDDLVPEHPSLVGALHRSGERVDGLAGGQALAHVGRLPDGLAQRHDHDAHVGPLHGVDLLHLVSVALGIVWVHEVQDDLPGILAGRRRGPEVGRLVVVVRGGAGLVLGHSLEDEVGGPPGGRDGEAGLARDALVGRGGRRGAEHRAEVEPPAGAAHEGGAGKARQRERGREGEEEQQRQRQWQRRRRPASPPMARRFGSLHSAAASSGASGSWGQ